MKIYFFGGSFEGMVLNILKTCHFDGVMFTYDSTQGDIFTQISRHINSEESFKYLVAIRPYTISPQYLCMINDSISKISPNRLQLNIITGHIKEHEKSVGGIIGEINDASDNVARSNYLIKFLHEMKRMSDNSQITDCVGRPYTIAVPDYYVSVSNQYVLDAAKETNSKIIFSYNNYKNNSWIIKRDSNMNVIELGDPIDLKGHNILFCMAPRLRKTQEEIDNLDKPWLAYDTEYFTYEQFEKFIEELKEKNINEMLLYPVPYEETEHIGNFVKQYKEKNKKIGE